MCKTVYCTEAKVCELKMKQKCNLLSNDNEVKSLNSRNLKIMIFIRSYIL